MANNATFNRNNNATVPDGTVVETVDQGSGVQRQVVKIGPSSTGTQANVAASASDVTILAANTSRYGASVFNDSTATLYLLLSNAVSSSSVYTVELGGNAYYEVPYGYTGIIKGIWASATGNARVTEFT